MLVSVYHTCDLYEFFQYLDPHPFSAVWVANIVSQFVAYHFRIFTVFFEQQTFPVNGAEFINLFFRSECFCGDLFQKSFPTLRS